MAASTAPRKTYKGARVVEVCDTSTLADFQKLVPGLTADAFTALQVLADKWKSWGAERVLFGKDPHNGLGILRLIQYRTISMLHQYVARDGSLI